MLITLMEMLAQAMALQDSQDLTGEEVDDVVPMEGQPHSLGFLVRKIYYSSVEKKQTGIRNPQIHLGGNAPRITKSKLCFDEYQYLCIQK